MAQTIVPAFEAGDGAPEGVVDSAKVREVLRDAKEGDFILSRLNAPLAPIAMALLRAQKRAKIAGRKLGLGLVELTRQVAKNTTTVEAMLSNLKAWEEKQTARLMAKNLAEEVLDLQDRADTLRALAQGADSVEGLVARIDYLFEDDAQGAIILSSVHKAKGLEANRVWVLESTFYIDAKWTNRQEEKNLWYVAITRAKQHLTIVNENEKETVS
jgi:superfamily I DNA/RNA helicase